MARKPDSEPFRVRDYPFFFMHWIITKNNLTYENICYYII